MLLKRLAHIATVGALLVAGSAAAQDDNPAPESVDFSVPFNKWAAAGKKTDIPWQVYVSDPVLRYEQRLGVSIFVEVPGRKLAKLGGRNDLFLLARIGDQKGQWIEQGWVRRQIDKPLPKNTVIQFVMPFYLTPGRYRLALILYDRISQLYSVHADEIHAKELNEDPFPGSFAALPRVQWLPNHDPDLLLKAKSQARLMLPLNTRRPLHFEIVFILGDFEQRGIQRLAAFSTLDFAFSALHVLSQLEVPEASFHVTVVDPIRRNIVYEQKAGRRVDWIPINQAIRKINPGVINAQALEGYRENALFLRDVIRERLSEEVLSESGPAPLKVMLILGSPMLFPAGTVREPVVIEDQRDLLFFQLRYQPFGGYFRFHDDFEKVLKSAKPKRFDIANPQQFREGLAEIIQAIEKYPPGATRVAGANQPM